MFNKKSKHEHIYGKWEIKEISASTSFNSSTKLLQTRQCDGCGWTDTRLVEEVRT